jgi:hypothetical protein
MNTKTRILDREIRQLCEKELGKLFAWFGSFAVRKG